MNMGTSAQELKIETVNLYTDADMPEIFDRLAGLPFSFFLDSSLKMERFGSYSFIGFDPYLILRTKGNTATFHYRNGSERIEEINPFDALQKAFNERYILPDTRPAGLPPFIGGGIGYLSYELGRYIEKLPDSTIDDLNLPELMFCFYDKVISADHRSGGKWLIVTAPETGDLKPVKDKALSLLSSFNTAPEESCRKISGGNIPVEFTSGFSRDKYMEAVEQVKEYILAGDIFQANLSQRFSAPLTLPPWDLYRRLRVLNAAPFSAYLNCGDYSIASSSPERFLKVTGSTVETRPIKGTRPRSKDLAEDEQLKNELLSSSKDLAELSMIVDLERNDLGRVCDYGSVRVEEHAVIESYATVHHLVSTVTGNLHTGNDISSLLKATFPGGSITGAPKIRSIEIIDELEPTVRSVYTGGIGYVGYDGQHDINVAIRTMTLCNGRAYFQVGGGITAGSDPASEYQETLDKGKAIFQSITGDDAEPILTYTSGSDS